MKKILVLVVLASAVVSPAVTLNPNVMTGLPANSPLPLGTPLATNSQTISLIGFYDNLPYATVTVTSMVLQEPNNNLIFHYTFANHSTSAMAVGGANIVPTGAFWKDAYSGFSTGGQDAVAAFDNLFGVQVRYGWNIYGDPCIVPGTTGSAFWFRTNAPSFAVGSAQVYGNGLAEQAFNFASVYVPVPEPATMVALGFGMMALIRRRSSN